MPELVPEDNQALFELFVLCDSQVKATMGGAYAMDWNIVIEVAKAMGIKTDKRFFLMLRAFETVMIEEMNRKNGRTE